MIFPERAKRTNANETGKDVPRSQGSAPMGNPYIRPILRGYLWVIVIILKNPIREHNKIPWLHVR